MRAGTVADVLLLHPKRPRREADEFIKGCPEAQSMAIRVEAWAAEPQVVVILFLIVAQAARNFEYFM